MNSLSRLLGVSFLLIAVLFTFSSAPAQVSVLRSVISGNWNSTSTWDLGSVPTFNDSVIVEAGDTVTVNSSSNPAGALNVIGYLKFDNTAARALSVNTSGNLSGDVVVSGTLAFGNQNNQRLTVFGSLNNTGAITTPGSFTSSVVFQGSGTKTLSTNSNFKSLTINGSSLNLQLGSDITVTQILTLTAGTITTGSNKITSSNSSSSAVVITGGTINGKIQRSIAAGGTGTYLFTEPHTSFQPISGQAATTMTITSYPGTAPPNVNTGAAVNRYYAVDAAGITGTLHLAYLDSELGSVTESNASLFRYSGISWEDKGGTVDLANNFVMLDSVSSFSNWTIGDSNNPLPVELSSLSAQTLGSTSVRLEWSTQTELNNLGFYVERRTEHTAFERVSQMIPAAGTTLEPQQYEFTDGGVTLGTYYYRLGIVDQNNLVTYSHQIVVEVSSVLDAGDGLQPLVFGLAQNYPNPFNPTTKIDYSIESAGTAVLTIFNSLGQEVTTLVHEEASPGRYTVEWNAGNIPSGQYICRLTSAGKSEVKKMLFVR